LRDLEHFYIFWCIYFPVAVRSSYSFPSNLDIYFFLEIYWKGARCVLVTHIYAFVPREILS